MSESEKKLQFLLDMMESKGMGKHELARLMGVSPQNIFTYFKRDDMKLSYAQEVAGKLGYDLSIVLEKDEAPLSNVIVNVEALVGQEGILRLAFLRIAMRRYGIERKALAEKLGLNYTGVNRWFKVDDIAISYIYRIAELYGLKVKIDARKKVNNLPNAIVSE